MTWKIVRSLLLTAIICAAALSHLPVEIFGVSSAASQDTRQEDREVAARFAPIFYQGLGDRPRNDYITGFDFDGDWRGDNNWDNADNRRFPLRANVYYAVSETTTHLFIHYAVFHPRDYKGGEHGILLSELLRQGAKHGGKYDPTGQLAEAVLAHENDMEGCLVVVAKNGDDLERASVAFVETLAHDRFLKYAPEGAQQSGFDTVSLEGQRARLYVEPKGHGVEAYRGGESHRPRNGTLKYSFAGRADDPEQYHQDAVAYDLVSLSTTLWSQARESVNQTYGRVDDYGSMTLSVVRKDGRKQESKVKLGKRGSAFLGAVGASNMARPPWGWFDRSARGEPLGAWFFDPAQTIKRHFNRGTEFSTSYTYAPFLGITRQK
jgi:hypothetical protein